MNTLFWDQDHCLRYNTRGAGQAAPIAQRVGNESDGISCREYESEKDGEEGYWTHKLLSG